MVCERVTENYSNLSSSIIFLEFSILLSISSNQLFIINNYIIEIERFQDFHSWAIPLITTLTFMSLKKHSLLYAFAKKIISTQSS